MLCKLCSPYKDLHHTINYSTKVHIKKQNKTKKSKKKCENKSLILKLCSFKLLHSKITLYNKQHIWKSPKVGTQSIFQSNPVENYITASFVYFKHLSPK